MDNLASKYTIPGVVGMNVVYYYYMRFLAPNRTLHFHRVLRTIAFGLFVTGLSTKNYAYPKCRKELKLSINKLFD